MIDITLINIFNIVDKKDISSRIIFEIDLYLYFDEKIYLFLIFILILDFKYFFNFIFYKFSFKIKLFHIFF
jgi:hypothetical protein